MGTSVIDKHRHEFSATAMIFETINYKQIILTDSPDIVFETQDGKYIGIEVIDCVVSSIRSNNKRNRVRVENDIRKAEKIYERQLIERGETNIHIHISFEGGVLDAPQKGFTAKFIEEIERHRKNDWMEKEYFSRIEDPEFRELYRKVAYDGGFKYDYIKAIECIEHQSLETSVYHLCCFCFSDNIEEKDIEKCVKKKESLLTDKYQKMQKNSNIKEYWLAIWVPSEEHINIDDYTQIKDIDSNYRRIYLTCPYRVCKRIK